MQRKGNWIAGFLGHLEEYITMFFFAVMCVSLFLQLLSRFVLRAPFFFTEEVSRFSYIWVTFVGLSYAIKHDAHIKIEVFVNLLPEKVRKVESLLVSLVSLALFVYLVVWSCRFVEFNKVIMSPALEVSMTVITISLPIGFGLAALRTGSVALRQIRELRYSGVESHKKTM